MTVAIVDYGSGNLRSAGAPGDKAGQQDAKDADTQDQISTHDYPRRQQTLARARGQTLPPKI